MKEVEKGYWNDPEVRTTAEFIKRMTAGAMRRRSFRPRVNSDLFLYGFLAFILFAFVFLTLSPGKTTEIRRTIVETPIIETNVSVLAGGRPSQEKPTLEEWWNMSLNVSCEGIEKFYSDTNFTADWSNLLRGYNDIYSHNGYEPMGLKPPIDMLKNSTNYDCEDVAHATRCLAALYNVTCSFWMRENTGRVVPASEEHLGVCCEYPKSKWGCI